MIRGTGLPPALLLVAAAAALSAPAADRIDLGYPLPSNLPATASFGEYRPGHLHAGLDFSTGGELGWPVRAAAAGEVFRLKVESRGYGRAVYVRHPGGFVSVYAHLHRFQDVLEARLQAAIEVTGKRFPGDVAVDPPVPVRAGQTIGLSGETGGGPPHLHFELRRDDEPVDPTRYGGLRPQGFGVPVLDDLWVVPRGATRIDRRWDAERYEFVRVAEGYRLKTTPVVEGAFDLEVGAHVPGNGTLGLAGLELRCGGRVRFRADLHRFGFDQYRQSGLVYDPARSGTGPTRYTYRLRAAAGMDLPGVEGAWLEPPDPGPLTCRLEAWNARGDRTAGEFTLQVEPSPGYAEDLPEEVHSHAMFPDLLVVNGEIPLDPWALPAGAAKVAGMPQIAAPGREEVAVLPRQGLEIRFPAGAAYGITAVSLDAAVDAPAPEDGLEVVVAPVRLDPPDLFLRIGARWEAQVADPVRSALYRLDPDDGSWNVVGKEPIDGGIRQAVRLGGTYAVLRDRSAPAILAVQLREEARLGARRLVFPTREIGEGIDVEAFEVTVDGKSLVAAFDPDHGWGEAWLPDGLTGVHRITAACRDRAGNNSPLFEATVEL